MSVQIIRYTQTIFESLYSSFFHNDFLIVRKTLSDMYKIEFITDKFRSHRDDLCGLDDYQSRLGMTLQESESAMSHVYLDSSIPKLFSLVKYSTLFQSSDHFDNAISTIRSYLMCMVCDPIIHRCCRRIMKHFNLYCIRDKYNKNQYAYEFSYKCMIYCLSGNLLEMCKIKMILGRWMYKKIKHYLTPFKKFNFCGFMPLDTVTFSSIYLSKSDDSSLVKSYNSSLDLIYSLETVIKMINAFYSVFSIRAFNIYYNLVMWDNHICEYSFVDLMCNLHVNLMKVKNRESHLHPYDFYNYYSHKIVTGRYYLDKPDLLYTKSFHSVEDFSIQNLINAINSPFVIHQELVEPDE